MMIYIGDRYNICTMFLWAKNGHKKTILCTIPFWNGKTRYNKNTNKKRRLENTNNKIVNFQKKYSLLLSPSFVKICSLGTMIAWFSALLFGIIIGQFDQAGPNYDLAGFNPLIDYISNLGSFEYNPIPIVFNFCMMLTCLFTMPVSLYTKRKLNEDKNVFWKIISSGAVLFLTIGFTALFFAGLVNLDVSEILNELDYRLSFFDYHSMFSNLAFVFLGCGCNLLSVVYLFRGKKVDFLKGSNYPILSKVLLLINTWLLTPLFIIFMANSPVADCADRFWIYLPLWKWAPMWEWLTVLSITATIYWLCIKLLKPLNRELLTEKS